METLEKMAAVTRVHTDFFDPDKDARTTLALPSDLPSPEGDAAPAYGTEPGTRARIQAELRQLHQLASAFDYPKRNRPAYMGALEQMLALARTIENRQQEAWMLWQLGRVKIEENELDDAKQHILAARQIFAAENMTEYLFHATQDLTLILSEQGEFDAARSYLEELIESPERDVRWRALISLGNLYYLQHDYPGALRYFNRAAEQLEQVDPEQRAHEGVPALLNHVADIARATGHYEGALLLWNRCLQQATLDRRADAFLEALMEVAQCCQMMGRISEARQRLELAVVLASFLFEDESRFSVARALLADVLVAMGSLDEAKESARMALKVAHRVRAARPTILSSLAYAETNLAVGQWDDALAYAQDALEEAKRSSRTREVALARDLRARAYLRQYEELRTTGDVVAQEALSRAFTEAQQALELATQTDSVREQVSARLTMARCYFWQGDEAEAEREARGALALTEDGAVGLTPLLGKETENLPALMLSAELDLPNIFAGRRVNLPALEWQAHYLEGTLRARRLGPEEAFSAMRAAAKSISQLLAGLNQTEAAALQKRHPEMAAVFQDLKRFALTESARQETAQLLESARWAAPETDLPVLTPTGRK
jgi:tetratricopeptide (TPR) repeat protein